MINLAIENENVLERGMLSRGYVHASETWAEPPGTWTREDGLWTQIVVLESLDYMLIISLVARAFLLVVF